MYASFLLMWYCLLLMALWELNMVGFYCCLSDNCQDWTVNLWSSWTFSKCRTSMLFWKSCTIVPTRSDLLTQEIIVFFWKSFYYLAAAAMFSPFTSQVFTDLWLLCPVLLKRRADTASHTPVQNKNTSPFHPIFRNPIILYILYILKIFLKSHRGTHGKSDLFNCQYMLLI